MKTEEKEKESNHLDDLKQSEPKHMICSTEEVKGEMNADVEVPVNSSIEENIRMDHDDLQEENKRVLAKYSTSSLQSSKIRPLFRGLTSRTS